MAEIVNLRMARKARKRSEDQAKADRNRLLSGRTKAQKAIEQAENVRALRDLEGHRRDPE
ncbi:DUF4169 family protein [Novosphingobium sp. TH158]|uniref:DUF4169 family protein n=1 Tax=Novosphingobium sp. TH158 TaxID=2067455 RepID=UPI000C7BADCF|nr:DUF4169 family protein [Novosphingobium sp. TH158]PLK26420.1 DUF4169 domain-containing protein [Novosphingobium sp. TH158]